MTREDIERMFAYQAADAAYKYASERCRKDKPISASKFEAFEAGADWAQEFMIERACEWLRNNIDFYVETNYGEDFRVDIQQLLNDIRKAMEE